MRRIIALSALASLLSCAGRQQPREIGLPDSADTSAVQWLTPRLHIRSSFDTDPGLRIGAFFPDGQEPLNEASAVDRVCSRYISYRPVSGGGVEYDEYFYADSEAAARLGMPQELFKASAGAGQQVAVRVKYTLENKLQHVISDPEGFAECCAERADQCGQRFIGEFVGGTGEVFYAVGTVAELEARGLSPAAMGELEARDGRYWRAALKFPNAVYLAYQPAENPYTVSVGGLPSGSCDEVSWDDAPPEVRGGQYFVGISDFQASEQLAREGALRNASENVSKSLRQSVETGNERETTFGGRDGEYRSSTDGSSLGSVTSSADLEGVKDHAWCTVVDATPVGVRYKVKVAVFYPN